MSNKRETVSTVNARIAERVGGLRRERGLSLDALAKRSGVSRSMISLVERGEASPTAVVLAKIAAGLGVTLASLFEGAGEGGANREGRARRPVSRRKDQTEWRDPASGYVRRNVSPPGMEQPIQIVEVRFPPGRSVSFETATRRPRIQQQVWVLEGTMDVTAGDERHRLREGDCLAMNLDRPTFFHNPTKKTARYAVVIAAEPMGGKR